LLAAMSSDDLFLHAAASIGRRIVSDAVWHGGRCSWMGVVVDPAQSWRAEYRALGPNLYGGTAGVGLFLAQLAAVTDDTAVHRTAVGAMRHAMERAHAMPPDRSEGFYEGYLGIAWAIARAASLLGEEELHTSARALQVTAMPRSDSGRCPDVVLGTAGSIIALLALADAFNDPTLIEDAFVRGVELSGRATVTRRGWSWAIPGRRDTHHLCGLSHGSGGIGWALLELFVATGDGRFRAGAMGAFAYERSWLHVASGTWPDLRIEGPGRGTPIASPAVGTWCHGEAGIALTRLHAIALLGLDAHGDDAEAALETTCRHLAGALAHEIDDLSLCHGAAGAAEVLLCGASVLGEQWHKGADLSEDLGRVVLQRYDAAAGNKWPSGVAGGTTPGLFRGLSGIAWWFLRLHDRAIPSPLTMPRPVLTATGARA
jgi:lantibiotic modifying enzyme